ncbi:MAG: hypothetical protein ACTSU0_11870 [Alphaproteobacteria bacterium]
MATFNKFEDFALQLGKGTHQLHAAGHVIEVYLSNAAPSASADTVKADLAEITNENGYTAPEDTANDYTEASGTGTLTGVDVTVTASGGTVGPFQYVVLQNTTPSSPLDPLIGWWDHGSAVTLQSGESFTVDFGASVATLV